MPDEAGRADGTESQWLAAVGECSERGPLHETNEDACAVLRLRDASVLVVADGMGGKVGGDVAARVAVQTVHTYLATSRGGPIPARIRGALEQAHLKLQHLNQRAGAERSMGCACAVAAIVDQGLCIGHTGDTRIYRVFRRSGAIARLTRDMTLLQERLDDNEISHAEAQGHPDRRVLRGYLGQPGMARLTVPRMAVPLDAGDWVVVCTDGVTELVEDREIAEHVRRYAPAEAARRLVRIARERGSKDDATILIGRLPGPEPVRPATIPDRHADRTVSRPAEPGAQGAGRKPSDPGEGAAVAPPSPEAPLRVTPRVQRTGARRLSAWLLGTVALVLAAAAVVWLAATPPAPRAPKPAPDAAPRGLPPVAQTPRQPAHAPELAADATVVHDTARAAAAPDATAPERPPSAAEFPSLAARLARGGARSAQMLQILRGAQRHQLVDAGMPPELPPARTLPAPLDELLSPLPGRLEADDAARSARDKARAALLLQHVAALVLSEDLEGLRQLDAQLTFRGGEPHVKRMLLRTLALAPEPLLRDWIELHLYGARPAPRRTRPPSP